MDSFIYALVMVPALTDLLPRSGISASTGEVGFYGGLLFALFLIGWGFSLVWGPLADRFGRVRALMLSILCYSLFTFLGAAATRVWQLAVFRLLAGVGIGGEWSMGGTFVAEEWPEDRRKRAAGYMHTGYYFGFLLAALANHTVGAHFGWRAMFVIGGAPAFLVFFIRAGVRESDRFTSRSKELSSRWSMHQAFFSLFQPEYRKRTVVNALLVLISIVGLWAGSVYVPAALTDLATRAGLTPLQGIRLASVGTILLAVGTILGCLLMPDLAEWWGRRATLGAFFGLMLVFISAGFGFVFYLHAHAIGWFLVCLFFLGVGGANFAVYTLWLPEQYRTESRASAFAFATSLGRFVGAGITFWVGWGVSHYHTIGKPVAWTSIAFLLGLLLLLWGEETKGKPLPS